MKKYLFTIMMILICFISFGQSFKAGMSFGFTNTDVLGTDVNDDDEDFNKLGITIGLYAQLPLGEKSHIGFEMNFIEKGTYTPFQLDSSGAPQYGSHSFKLRLNYIEVPVLYTHQMSFTIGKKTIDRFSYEAGPSFGFLIYSDVNIDQAGYEPVTNYYAAYKKYDISGLVGLSYRFSDHWKIHVRYENSILAIHQHASGETGFNSFNLYYNPGEVNMVFTYTLSYTF